MLDSARIGQIVGIGLYEREWTGVAVILADTADLPAVHAAVTERWRTLLAAISSGLAHADPDDPDLSAREQAAEVTARLVIQPIGGGVTNGSAKQVVFASSSAPPFVPAGTTLAFIVGAGAPAAWQTELQGIAVVEVLG